MKKFYSLSANSLVWVCLTFAVVAGYNINSVRSADWPQFRGPDGLAVSAETGIPATWDENTNLVWRTKMPGMGTSSPIVVGDKIYLTAYSGYGMSRDEPGEMEDLIQHALCVDLKTGKILWDRRSKAAQPETEYGGMMALHGYASATPVSDGELVYFFFGKSGVYARKPDTGETVWSASVGTKLNEMRWGSANSLLLHKNLLIVNASMENHTIVALDKKTGKKVWETGEFFSSWSTPALVETPDGKTELVVSTGVKREGGGGRGGRGGGGAMMTKVWGLDADTGEKRWWCDGIPDNYVCPSVMVNDGIAYIFGGRTPHGLAVKPGGKDDVTETHVLWRCDCAPKVPTPVFYNGYIYWIDEKGFARAVSAQTGEEAYAERVNLSGAGEKLYASPIVVDGKFINPSREDGVVVLAVAAEGEKPEFKEIARNRFSDDESIFNATPVAVDGKLLIRSDTYLYCIGAEKE